MLTLNKVHKDTVEHGIRPMMAKTITIPVNDSERPELMGVCIYISASPFCELPQKEQDALLKRVAKSIQI